MQNTKRQLDLGMSLTSLCMGPVQDAADHLYLVTVGALHAVTAGILTA